MFSKRNNLEWKKLGWPNTPLGLYLDVDFEILATTITLTPRWMQKHQSGEITREQLGEAMESHHNVVDEFHMVLQKVAA